MAKAANFNVFSGATAATADPVPADPVPADPTEKPDEPETAAQEPAEDPAAVEPRKTPKGRQGSSQRRAGATQPAPSPVAVAEEEPDPEPEPERPVLTAAQEARWEQWLQSAAGKVRATREAADRSLADFIAGVQEARTLGVSEWTVRAAALRGRIELDDIPDA